MPNEYNFSFSEATWLPPNLLALLNIPEKKYPSLKQRWREIVNSPAAKNPYASSFLREKTYASYYLWLTVLGEEKAAATLVDTANRYPDIKKQAILVLTEAAAVQKESPLFPFRKTVVKALNTLENPDSSSSLNSCQATVFKGEQGNNTRINQNNVVPVYSA